MNSFSSATRSGELQEPSIQLSAKPMSPLFSAAEHTRQSCSRMAARGPPSAALPKWAWLPSGNCTSSVPICSPSSRRSTARAAAGAVGGSSKRPAAEVVWVVMASRGSKAVALSKGG
jgi:hypothetical protein